MRRFKGIHSAIAAAAITGVITGMMAVGEGAKAVGVAASTLRGYERHDPLRSNEAANHGKDTP